MAKEKGNSEEIKSKLLLTQNEYWRTALHLTAEGSVAVLEKLWDFATEEHQKQDELKLIIISQKQVWKRCLPPSCRTRLLRCVRDIMELG